MKYCQKDGFSVDLGEGFYTYCPECGGKLQEAPKCEQCGRRLTLTRYCVNCGAMTPYAEATLQRSVGKMK